PAEKALEERRLAKGKPVKKMQLTPAPEDTEDSVASGGGTLSGGAGTAHRGGQRVQPKSKKRKKSGNRPKGR
ncbi:MAG: hypothetical protein GX555_13470, partial [Actinomycetales bacterium]|nr:hypothetical protein [Actinomycetales bacterium]